MLGKGVYSLTDVARYTGVPASTVRSWFKPRSDGKGFGPIFRSDYQPVGGDFAVSFLDLIDAYVARFFRERGVSSPVIRAAHKILEEDLRTPHPFAHADLRAGNGRIILRTADAADAPELIDVVSRQAWFAEMQGWLSHFDYEKSTKLAARWNIAEGVVIDPAVSFGRPVVRHAGITTMVLANQYFANEKNSVLVAELYRVSVEDVLNAVRFEGRLKSTRAA